MTETLQLLACAVAFLPYAYVIARICSIAYFEQKLEYQKQFFKKFNIPTSGAH